MKKLLIILLIFPIAKCLAQKPLSFPVGLIPEMTFQDFKSKLSKRDYYPKLWVQSDNYKSFTKDSNLNEYSYSGQSPNIGTQKVYVFTAFFNNNRLVALKIIFSPEVNYFIIQSILTDKYSNPLKKDTLNNPISKHFTEWNFQNIDIILSNVTPDKKVQSFLEYTNISGIQSAKNQSRNLNTKDF